MALRRHSIQRIPLRQIGKTIAENTYFQNDIRELLVIPPKKWDQLKSAVCNADGFLNESEIVSVASACGLVDTAEIIGRTISRLSWMLFCVDDEDDDAILMLLQLIAASMKLESETDHDRIKSLLTVCLTARGLYLQNKSNELFSATGKTMSSSRFVCDIRPVFDEERSEVCGALAVCHLYMVYEDKLSPPETIEIRLSEAELETLADQIEIARGKLSEIRAFLKRKTVLQPTIEEM